MLRPLCAYLISLIPTPHLLLSHNLLFLAQDLSSTIIERYTSCDASQQTALKALIFSGIVSKQIVFKIIFVADQSLDSVVRNLPPSSASIAGPNFVLNTTADVIQDIANRLEKAANAKAEMKVIITKYIKKH